jgi:hypothetical protein
MTGSQYNQFTTNSQAPGINTINIEATGGVSITTSTFANVESYNLNGNADDHGYTIAGSNQTVTDNDNNGGLNTVTLLGGLTNVTLSTTGLVEYTVLDLGGGADHTFTLGAGNDLVAVDGGHTGLAIDLGGDNDGLDVRGVAAGVADGNAQIGGFGDRLVLHDKADISGLTVSNFERLFIEDNASVRIAAATWDQFVGTDGSATILHDVSGMGAETVDLTSTTSNVTTAFTLGSFPIEKYVLSSVAGDYFRVNTSTTYNAQVDLSGGGSDFLVFNGNSATVTGDADRHSTTLSFQGGATAAGGDVLQVQLATNSISSGTAIIVTAMDTDVTTERTLIINSFAGATMDETWSQGEARTAVNFAIDQIQAGTYTVAVYFSGAGQSGAYVMAMTTAADNPGAAVYDLIGILSSTAVNTLSGANFS